MKKRVCYFIFGGIAAVIVFILLAVGQIAGTSELTRHFNMTKDQEAEVSIGVAVPVDRLEEYTFFFQGIDMAIDEINSGGGILGRIVKIDIRDDKDDVTKALNVAQDLANDPEVHAVVGHWSSDVTIATAQTYGLNDTVLIAPVATAPELTELGYGYVFRGTITDEKVGERIAEYAKSKGYNKLAIYYDDTTSGKIQSKALEERCRALKIEVVDRHSVFTSEDAFENSYKKWAYRKADAVFIAGTVTNCEDVIRWIRKRNPEQVILGADGFDVDYFKDILGEDAEHIVYTSFLNNNMRNKPYIEFVEAFQTRFASEPDYWAVKAYDCMHLVKAAMEAAGTAESGQAIRDALAEDVVFKGVNGIYRFDENGDMTENIIVMKTVIDGEYAYIYDEE